MTSTQGSPPDGRWGRGFAVELLLVVAVISTGTLALPTFAGVSTVVRFPTTGATAIPAHGQLRSDLTCPAPGVATIGVGVSPATPLIVDSVDAAYVSNSGGDSVAVVNLSTGGIIVNLTVEANPGTPTFDPSDGDVYVPSDDPELASNNVTVISTSNDSLVDKIEVGAQPGTPTYDPANGDLYVPNTGGSTVSVISSENNSVIATIPAQLGPTTPVWDPANGLLYLTAGLKDNVTIINGTSNTRQGEIPVGADPSRPLLDPANGDLYVSNSEAWSVTVISTANNSVLGTIPLPTDQWPLTGTYVPTSGDIYVPSNDGGGLDVISGTSNALLETIPLGGELFPSVYDATNGLLYAPDGTYASAQPGVDVVNPVSNDAIGNISVGSSPRTPIVDPASGDIYVPDFNSSQVSVIPVGHPPALCVTLSASPTTGPAPLNVTLVAAVSGGTSPLHYDWNFSDGSTQSGTSASPTHVFEDAGVYDVRVNVTDATGLWGVQSTRVTVLPNGEYPVSLVEVGLPSGTHWSAQVASQGAFSGIAGGSPIVLDLANGTYPFSAESHDQDYSMPGGDFNVSGETVSVPVRFDVVRFTVTFTESGLPAGTNWSVTLGGRNNSSTGSTIQFFEGNASYTFTVGSVPAYDANRTTGQVVVAGAGSTELLGFTPHPGASSPPSLTDWEGYSVVGAVLVAAAVGVILYLGRRRKSSSTYPRTSG